MWWNSLIHTRSREAVVGMSWEDFKTLTREEFFPVNEMQELETEFWNHAMVGVGHAAYTDRFHELARIHRILIGFRCCNWANLFTGASQSRQHVDTSVIHIESRKPPTKSLLDVGSRRISIVTVNTKEYHSNVLEKVKFGKPILLIGFEGLEVHAVSPFSSQIENSDSLVAIIFPLRSKILPVGDHLRKDLGVLGLGEASLSLDPAFLGF
ncbi:reverse transcriptase domain-containing protein [Tanacetum coccineum]